MALFAVQREFAEPVSPAGLGEIEAKTASGPVTHERSYLGAGGKFALSVFEAPDETSFVTALRSGCAPFAAHWSAWSYEMPERRLGESESLVLVERSFAEPVPLTDLEAKERAVAWCVNLYRVNFLWHVAANDGHHMVCGYGAPDAEAVRTVQVTAGMPFDRIWSAVLVAGGQKGEGEKSRGADAAGSR